jgi:hypothetical protein
MLFLVIKILENYLDFFNGKSQISAKNNHVKVLADFRHLIVRYTRIELE